MCAKIWIFSKYKLVVKKSQSIPGWSKYHVSNSKVAKLASSLGSLVSFLHQPLLAVKTNSTKNSMSLRIRPHDTCLLYLHTLGSKAGQVCSTNSLRQPKTCQPSSSYTASFAKHKGILKCSKYSRQKFLHHIVSL